MKILYVYGDEYAAIVFEDDLKPDGNDLRKFYDMSMAKMDDKGRSGEVVIDEPNGIVCRAFEFEAVDHDFVTWMRGEFMDYDESKHRDFYIVEE